MRAAPVAAVGAAKVHFGFADAWSDVARGFLAVAPEGRSGEDRTLVVVQVSADSLTGNVSAGTWEIGNQDVPAGTPTLLAAAAGVGPGGGA